MPKINITLDHFKPKAAPQYGWRNNEEKSLKTKFTIQVLDGDKELVNKTFNGYGPQPYKYQLDFDARYLDQGMKEWLVEEFKPSVGKKIFKTVLNHLQKAMIKACDDVEIGYWEGDWSGIADSKSIDEIKLSEPGTYRIDEYTPKYQKRLLNKILKDKTLFSNLGVGEKVIKIDAVNGYKWVESGAIDVEKYATIVIGRTDLSNKEREFLKDNKLDINSLITIEMIFKKNNYLKMLDDDGIDCLISQIKKLDGESDEIKSELESVINCLLHRDYWLHTENENLSPTKKWLELFDVISELIPLDDDFLSITKSGIYGSTRFLSFEDEKTVDAYADLWVHIYEYHTPLIIYEPLVLAKDDFVRIVVKKAMQIHHLHQLMSKYYDKIEDIGLVEQYENARQEHPKISNLHPKNKLEEDIFFIQVINPSYWTEKNNYQEEGVLDTFSNIANRQKMTAFMELVYIFNGIRDLEINIHESNRKLLLDLYLVMLGSLKEYFDQSSMLLVGVENLKKVKFPSSFTHELIERVIDTFLYCAVVENSNRIGEAFGHQDLVEKINNLPKPEPEPYEEYYDNGNLKLKGLQTCDEKVVVAEWYENGQQMSETPHVNGKKEDVHTRWYPNGQKQTQNYYEDGLQQGLSIWWYENGQKRQEREYFDDFWQGTVKKWSEDGTEDLDVTKKVYGVSYFSRHLPSGQKLHEVYTCIHNDVFNGDESAPEFYERWWHKNGQIRHEIPLDRECKRNGRMTSWDDQGNVIFTADWNDNNITNRNGTYENAGFSLPSVYELYEVYIKDVTTWVNDVQHGPSIEYETELDDDTGEYYLEAKTTTMYEDGQQVEGYKSITIYYRNGNTESEIPYMNDEKHGRATWWNEDGTIESQQDFVNGKNTGLFIYWHPNGQKAMELNLLDDERHGLTTLWDEDGVTTFIATYEHGESSDQNGREPQYDEDGNLTHYIEYENGNILF